MYIVDRWETDVGKGYIEELLRALGNPRPFWRWYDNLVGYHGRSDKIEERRRRKGVRNMIPPSPFGRVGGREDLRGLSLPNRAYCLWAEFRDCDLSSVDFEHRASRRCFFNNVVFEKGRMMDFRDYANEYKNCVFKNAEMMLAGIGFDGSTYKNCRFERCDFHRAIFSRAEFDNCVFERCKLKGVDFNGSSFENCTFEGLVEDVWFRGGFALPSEVERAGKPRPNKMKNVSFENATLRFPTFSDHCDLSTTILPNDGNHFFFDKWQERLEALTRQAKDWPEPMRERATAFAECHLTHAKKQETFIINRDDVFETYGDRSGTEILAFLRDGISN